MNKKIIVETITDLSQITLIEKDYFESDLDLNWSEDIVLYDDKFFSIEKENGVYVKEDNHYELIQCERIVQDHGKIIYEWI